MLKIALKNESTNNLKAIEINNILDLEELENYFEGYLVEKIEVFHAYECCDELDDFFNEVLENENRHDIPYLESQTPEDLYNILSEIEYIDFEQLPLQQDAAEYKCVSVFEINLDDFQQTHTIYSSLDSYLDSCDEILRITYPEFFDSSDETYFNYEKYHDDMECYCSEMTNGNVIAE